MHKVFLCRKGRHAWWRGEAKRGREGETEGGWQRRDPASLSLGAPCAAVYAVPE